MAHVGYGCYPAMPENVKAIYEPLKKESQKKLLTDLYDQRGGAGSKYKKKYEESEKQFNVALMKLADSGMSAEELAEAFGFDSKKTVQNRISKARGY